MPDLVNDTGKSQLSQRNSEPNHNAGAAWDDLGGPTWDHKGGPDAYKIDATKGTKGTDTSIPKSVPAEQSHRSELNPGIVEDEKVDVDFGDDDKDLKEADDLDKELDKFESVDEPEVSVDVEDDDDDDKKKVVKEDADEQGDQGNPVGQSEIKKQKNGVQGDETTTDQTDDFVKEDDSEPEGKDADAGKLSFSDVQVDEEEEDTEDKKFPFTGKKEEDGLKETKKVVKESFKIHVKMPKTPLFESVDSKARKQVAAVYEQALRANTKAIAKQLTEHFNGRMKEQITKRDAVLAKQVDAYLTYVTEEWVKANKVAIKTNIRTQLAEEFLTGLHSLFKEHYIDVPASKIDVVKQLTAQNAKLKTKLNEEHGKMLKLRKLTEAVNKQRLVAQFGRTLSEAQVAKLTKLAEDVPYTNAAEFREKLTMLKESYFGDGKTDVKDKRLPLSEAEVKEDVKSEKRTAASSDPFVAAAAAALKNQADASKW
jgi:hypothetical protein